MKKSIFFTFVLAAGFAATFLTSCGDDGAISGCNTIAGRDTGAHSIFLAAIDGGTLGLKPIRDTLDAAVFGDSVSIHSMALGRYLSGKIDPSNCNNILLDSVIFGEFDTLKIPTTLAGVPNGVVEIWGVRGGGSGTITSSGSNTVISISKGSTNVSSPIDLRNLNGRQISLKGKFLNL